MVNLDLVLGLNQFTLSQRAKIAGVLLSEDRMVAFIALYFPDSRSYQVVRFSDADQSFQGVQSSIMVCPKEHECRVHLGPAAETSSAEECSVVLVLYQKAQSGVLVMQTLQVYFSFDQSLIDLVFRDKQQVVVYGGDDKQVAIIYNQDHAMNNRLADQNQMSYKYYLTEQQEEEYFNRLGWKDRQERADSFMPQLQPRMELIFSNYGIYTTEMKLVNQNNYPAYNSFVNQYKSYFNSYNREHEMKLKD